MVGTASLAPRALSFASFLAREVLLLIQWRLLRGGNVDSCGWRNERWVLRGEVCGLHRRRWCLILLWRWCVRLWLWRGHGEHREFFFHFGHIGFRSRSTLSVLGDCLREVVVLGVGVYRVHCYTEFLSHRGAASFRDFYFILVDHVFAKNGPFFPVGRDDLIPPLEGFHVHSSAFGELD